MLLAQIIVMGIGSAQEVVNKSGKDYKSQEAERRNRLTPDERLYEDTCRFNRRLSRM